MTWQRCEIHKKLLEVEQYFVFGKLEIRVCDFHATLAQSKKASFCAYGFDIGTRQFVLNPVAHAGQYSEQQQQR
jgi:hypothetical protein